MNRAEIETYVKQLPSVKTQQYFYAFVETKNNALNRFIKNDCLKPLGANLCFNNYTLEELLEILQRKSAELEAKENQEKKNPFKALLLHFQSFLTCGNLSSLTGINLADMSVLEKEKVYNAIILASFYVNCKPII